VFKVEAQHVVMFMFTESRVALYGYIRRSCVVGLGGLRSRRVWGAGRSVRQITAVLGRSGATVSREIRRLALCSVPCWPCVHGVAGDRSGTGECCWTRTSHTRLFRVVRLHICSDGHSAVPGRTGRTPISAPCARDTVAHSGVDGRVQTVSGSGCLSMSAPHTSTTTPCLDTGNQTPSWEQKRWVRGFIPRWNQ